MSAAKGSSDDLRTEFDRLDEVRILITNKFNRNIVFFASRIKMVL
jgi:hypothetical protein